MSDDSRDDPVHEIIQARRGFGHREHLELAWTLLARYDLAAAKTSMGAALRRIAAVHGTPERYHHTITLSWMQLVAFHKSRSRAASFEDFLAESPGLLDKQLLARHYSAQTMWSETARRRWVAPDLTRLTCGTTLQSRLRPVRLPIARRI